MSGLCETRLSICNLHSDVLCLILGALDDCSRVVSRFVARRFRDLVPLQKGERSFGVDVCAEAAKRGWLSVVKWARSQGAWWNERTFDAAVTGGNTQVISWLKANGCPWDAKACIKAARYGHLQVLESLFNNGVYWNDLRYSQSKLFQVAIKGKHFHIIEWLISHGLSFNKDACAAAARYGNTQLLSALQKAGCPCDSKTVDMAARNGHLETIQWALANGLEWNEGTSAEAAKGGSLELLRWAVDNGLPVDEESIMIEAIQGGHCSIIEWRLTRGIAFSADACFEAASKGDLDLLKRLHEKGAPLDKYVANAAAHYGSTDMLQWLSQKGCPWSKKVFKYAASGGRVANLNYLYEHRIVGYDQLGSLASFVYDPDVLQWLKEHGVQQTCLVCLKSAHLLHWEVQKRDILWAQVFCPEHLHVIKWLQRGPHWLQPCEQAAREGNVDVLQYLLPPTEIEEHQYELICAEAVHAGHLNVLQLFQARDQLPHSTRFCAIAADAGHLAILQWLRAHQAPWSKEVCRAAVVRNHLSVLTWALKNGAPIDWQECLHVAKTTEIKEWLVREQASTQQP